MPPYDHDNGQARPNHRHAQSGPPTSPSLPTVLTAAHISEAIQKSPDNGSTLDLSHCNLTDVGVPGAEELATIGREGGMDEESSVVRIALSYNRLATLPTSFALLSRLRYLNLRNNSFTVFPHVLTIMPSLEILDIRRNKIKRFPPHPGSLLNLKVLSMARNRISRLPTYFAEFRALETLGIEHNPIDWPPKLIVDPLPDASNKEAMKDWIQMLQGWIEQHALSTETRKLSDDSALNDSQDWEFAGLDSYGVDSPNFGHDPDYMATTPHARKVSTSSGGSVYSEHPVPSLPKPQPTPKAAPSPRPPPLQLGFLSSPAGGSTNTSPSRSPDSYLPTPEGSTGSQEDNSHLSQIDLYTQHGRNASYAVGPRTTPRPGLSSKKSMPDLRTAKFPFGTQAGLPDRGPRQRAQTNAPGSSNPLQPPRPQFAIPRQDSANSDELLVGTRSGKSTFGVPYVTTSPTTREMPPQPVDIERNSYFRRLSTISSSTVHKSVPPALLTVVEGVRDLMFAVTQIYQTLDHYAQCAGTGTLSSVLKKVLDPASAYIARVINALDRFDSASRRAIPAPPICRAVIEGCKDMVAGFGKAVELLFAQLKVFAMNEDKRYTRQMLLVLYGSTAEIARAWTVMYPNIDAVRPLLNDRPLRGAPSARARTVTPAGRFSNEPPASAPATSSPFLPGVASPLTPALRTRTGFMAGNLRKARRQAGSFSVQDVELGREMASAAAAESPPPPPPSALISPPPSQTPTPKATMNMSTAPPVRTPMGPPPLPLQLHLGFTMSPMVASAKGFPWGGHSRQGSQASLNAANSPSSSPVIPVNSSTLADKEAIAAVEQAVDAAPPVWKMMEELSGDLNVSEEELREGLERARAVTTSLKERLGEVKDGEFVGNRQALREDANVFIKIVVQLSNMMKSYSGTRMPASVVRAKMVLLTNATEACLMLLHVSSFSAVSTPRAHSPLVMLGSPGTPLEDHRLTPSLGRSRSAVAGPLSARSPVNASPWREVPRSALPHQQAFKVGTPLRNVGMSTPRIGDFHS